jgi:acetate kinase
MQLDCEKDDTSSGDCTVSSADSPVSMLVLATDEELFVA